MEFDLINNFCFKKSDKYKYFTIRKYNNNNNPYFICPYCSSTLSYFHTLKRHIREKHETYAKIKCSECGKLQIPYRLKEHFYKRHKNKKEFSGQNELINDVSFSLPGTLINIQSLNFEIIKENSINDIFEKLIIKYNKDISLLFEKYFIFKEFKIDEGSFGIINFGITRDKKNAIAIKTQGIKIYQKTFDSESEYLKKLQKYEYFPKFFDYYQDKYKTYLFEELYGPSFKKLYDFCDENLDIITISNIGIDIISCINALHEEGIYHMDVKKSNIIWIMKKKENHFPDLCLIDYNLSRNIDDNIRKKNRGNQKYASLNVLLGNKINRKDDLISLCYLLIELINGKLPWSKIKYENIKDKKEQIIIKKKILIYIITSVKKQRKLVLYLI